MSWYIDRDWSKPDAPLLIVSCDEIPDGVVWFAKPKQAVDCFKGKLARHNNSLLGTISNAMRDIKRNNNTITEIEELLCKLQPTE